MTERSVYDDFWEVPRFIVPHNLRQSVGEAEKKAVADMLESLVDDLILDNLYDIRSGENIVQVLLKHGAGVRGDWHAHIVTPTEVGKMLRPSMGQIVLQKVTPDRGLDAWHWYQKDGVVHRSDLNPQLVIAENDRLQSLPYEDREAARQAAEEIAWLNQQMGINLNHQPIDYSEMQGLADFMMQPGWEVRSF